MWQAQGQHLSSLSRLKTRSITLALAGLGFAAASSAAVAQHEHHDMAPSLTAISLSRAGSGTSWLPDSARVPMAHKQLGDWMLMLHASGVGMFDRQWTLHGDTRWGVLDWE